MRTPAQWPSMEVAWTYARILEHRVAERFHQNGFSDITPAQTSVLTALFELREPADARHIGAMLSLNEAVVYRHLAAMERGGWLSRADGRYALTEKAWKSLPKLIRLSNQLLDQAFAGLGQREIESFSDTLAQIRRNLDGA